MRDSSTTSEGRSADLAQARPTTAHHAARDERREAARAAPVCATLRDERQRPTGRPAGIRPRAVPDGWSAPRRTRGRADRGSERHGTETRGHEASDSFGGPSAGENPAHDGREPLPVLGFSGELLFPRSGDRVEPGAAVVFGYAPLRPNPAALLKTYQRRVNRPLVQDDAVSADLLNPSRDPVPVERSH